MFRTEASFFEEHVKELLRVVTARIRQIENAGDYTADDEMELAALDRLTYELEDLLGAV